jgi:hypothetical protein
MSTRQRTPRHKAPSEGDLLAGAKLKKKVDFSADFDVRRGDFCPIWLTSLLAYILLRFEPIPEVSSQEVP